MAAGSKGGAPTKRVRKAAPAKKAQPKKATPAKAAPAAKAKAAPRKRGPRIPPAQVTEADREQAAAMVSNVTPIRGERKSRSGARSTTSAQALRLQERRERALNYRRLGLTWKQVAERVRAEYATDVPRYSHADAYNDARHLLDAVTVEAVQGQLEEDLALLLALQRRVLPMALDGHLGAVDRQLRILERRAKYLGLDSPIQHELSGTGGGPVLLAAADPRVVYETALGVLDEALPHVPPPELPAPPA